VDLELLDLELLARLAERFDLREVWERWYARAKDADFGTERAR
jgi:negative regulator of sigma E activity